MAENGNSGNGATWLTATRVVSGILWVIIAALAGWSIRSTQVHEVEIARLKENKFTATEAAALETRLSNQLTEIKIQIVGLQMQLVSASAAEKVKR